MYLFNKFYTSKEKFLMSKIASDKMYPKTSCSNKNSIFRIPTSTNEKEIFHIIMNLKSTDSCGDDNKS